MTATRFTALRDVDGDAARGSAGFVFGPSKGVSSWPLPRPATLMWGWTPSGFDLEADEITAWRDAMGLWAPTPLASTRRPSIATIDGVRVASHDGVDEFVCDTAATPWTATKGEVWLVAKPGTQTKLFPTLLGCSGAAPGVGDTHTFQLYMDTGASPYKLWLLVGLAADATRGYVRTTNDVLTAGTTHVIRVLSTDTAYQIWVDGSNKALTTVVQNNGKWFGDIGGYDSVALASYRYNDGTLSDAANPYKGEIGFFCVFEGINLTTDQAALLLAQLQRIFGL